jgi:hypothetical protein
MCGLKSRLAKLRFINIVRKRMGLYETYTSMKHHSSGHRMLLLFGLMLVLCISSRRFVMKETSSSESRSRCNSDSALLHSRYHLQQ